MWMFLSISIFVCWATILVMQSKAQSFLKKEVINIFYCHFYPQNSPTKYCDKVFSPYCQPLAVFHSSAENISVLGCEGVNQTASDPLFSPQVCPSFALFSLSQRPDCSPTTTCCGGCGSSHKTQRNAPRWLSSYWTARSRPGNIVIKVTFVYRCSFHCVSIIKLSLPVVPGIGVEVENLAAS